MSFDSRPFKSIEEHDEALIENWNNAVGMDDDVYLLGDISRHNSTKTIEIFNELNGNIHLIVGNHDGKLLNNREFQKRFCEILQRTRYWKWETYRSVPLSNSLFQRALLQ